MPQYPPPPPPPLLLVSYPRKCTRGQRIHLLTNRGFGKLIAHQFGSSQEIETPGLKYSEMVSNTSCGLVHLAYSPDILVVSSVMNMVSVLSISTELHSSTNVEKPE